MRLPIIPILVAAILLGLAVYVLNTTTSGKLVMDAPLVGKIADVEGIETEVSVAPDGNRYAVVSSGVLWLLDTSKNTTRKISQVAAGERFPNWTPDGKRLTFTRGADTLSIDADLAGAEQVFKANATSLSWSRTGRIAFVRNRGLWLADPNGANERQVVEPDANPETTIEAPRFSPDSVQLAFIKKLPGIRGELWVVNALTGAAYAAVADRQTENPMDVGWDKDGRNIVYLTNRAGSYAVWLLDTTENTVAPLTPPLFDMPLSDVVSMTVWEDRIVLPRYFIDSDVTWNDGAPIVQSDAIEFEPAISPNGETIAYTVAKENKFEIWTAGIHGENPVFRTLGREARFSPNGFQIVYTHSDLTGNPDLWTTDLRDNRSESVTDADEIDLNPDWSPDGRTIAFSSNRGGNFAIWTIGTSGGKRVRLNDGGRFPRYSPDGKLILFWNKNAFWTMTPAGESVTMVRADVPGPVAGIWTNAGPRYFRDPDVSGANTIWPAIDISKAGKTVIAPIEFRASELWSIQLEYKKQ